MTIAASGSLGIISVAGSACSSISAAVCGGTGQTSCLSALSVAAGKSAPHAMTEFYSYVPENVVNMTSYLCCNTNLNAACVWKCGCLTYSKARVASTCYNVCFCYVINSAIVSGVACVNIYSGATQVLSCVAAGPVSCNGTKCVNVKNADNICFWNLASKSGPFTGCACSCICIVSVTPVTGAGVASYCIGSTCILQTAITCNAPV